MNRMYRGPLGGYRPNPWHGFSWGSKHTTYVQNNFFGGPRPMGGGIVHFGSFGGYRNIGCGCNCGMGSFGKWMLGLGIGTTFLGGIMNAFGLGGGSVNNNYTTVIDDRNASTHTTRRESSRSDSSISLNSMQQQLDKMQQQLDNLTEELQRDNSRNRIGDSDTDTDADVDVDNDTDIDNDDERISGHTGIEDADNDSDSDDELTLTPGARNILTTSQVHANDYNVTKGDTWFHITQGMYTGPNGAKLSQDEIKAIYTALRAQYVDGGHVENGQVLDKNNQPVNISNMDLPRGVLKLPDTLTINGKTYSYNKNGSVTKVNYTPGNVTKAGTYNARQTSDSKWIATINGQDCGTTKYDSKQEAIEAAEAIIEEELAGNDNKPITE